MICNKDRYGIFKKSPARCSDYLEPKIFIIAMKEKTCLFPLKFCSFQWIRTIKAITKTIENENTWENILPGIAQKMKLPIEDLFSICDQIRTFLRI